MDLTDNLQMESLGKVVCDRSGAMPSGFNIRKSGSKLDTIVLSYSETFPGNDAQALQQAQGSKEVQKLQTALGPLLNTPITPSFSRVDKLIGAAKVQARWDIPVSALKVPEIQAGLVAIETRKNFHTLVEAISKEHYFKSRNGGVYNPESKAVIVNTNNRTDALILQQLLAYNGVTDTTRHNLQNQQGETIPNTYFVTIPENAIPLNVQAQPITLTDEQKMSVSEIRMLDDEYRKSRVEKPLKEYLELLAGEGVMGSEGISIGYNAKVKDSPFFCQAREPAQAGLIRLELKNRGIETLDAGGEGNDARGAFWIKGNATQIRTFLEERDERIPRTEGLLKECGIEGAKLSTEGPWLGGVHIQGISEAAYNRLENALQGSKAFIHKANGKNLEDGVAINMQGPSTAMVGVTPPPRTRLCKAIQQATSNARQQNSDIESSLGGHSFPAAPIHVKGRGGRGGIN